MACELSLQWRRLSVVAVLVLATPWLAGCATNPVTGETDFVLMTEEQEIEAGRQSHQEVLKQYAVYEDPEVAALVTRIGKELVAGSHRSELDFTFTVLDSPEVNAFATHGGYVYITRGIMAYMNNEEQLAGVLGHEIGHVTARHTVRQHSSQTVRDVSAGGAGILAAVLTGNNEAAQASGTFIGQLGEIFVRGYGRGYELEADRLGAEYMASAGYDPQMMLGVVGILKDQEAFEIDRAREEDRKPRVYHGVFSTHPRNDLRLQEVVRAAEQFQLEAPRPTSPVVFLRLLEGMTFGDSPEQGILHENAIYHGPLDLHIAFPAGWQVNNNPANLFVISPQRDQAIIVSLDSPGEAGTPEQFLRKAFKNLSDGRDLDGGGYTGIAHGRTDAGSVSVRVSATFHDKRVLIVQGIGKDALPDEEVVAMTASVRGLAEAEKILAEGRRIGLTRAKAGDTFASLARSSPIKDYAEDQLRLLNGMYPDGEPAPGQLIKIVQ